MELVKVREDKLYFVQLQNTRSWGFLGKQRVRPRDIVSRECGILVWTVIYGALVLQMKSSASSNFMQSIFALHKTYHTLPEKLAINLKKCTLLETLGRICLSWSRSQLWTWHKQHGCQVLISGRNTKLNISSLNTDFCEPPVEELCPVFNQTLHHSRFLWKYWKQVPKETPY